MIKKIYLKDYQTSMYKCDNAMRNQFIAKAKVIQNPDKKAAKALESAEIALIDCHDYDVLRKRVPDLRVAPLASPIAFQTPSKPVVTEPVRSRAVSSSKSRLSAICIPA